MWIRVDLTGLDFNGLAEAISAAAAGKPLLQGEKRFRLSRDDRSGIPINTNRNIASAGPNPLSRCIVPLRAAQAVDLGNEATERAGYVGS